MKRRITTAKGTSSMVIEVGPSTFAEKGFLAYQKERLASLPSGMGMSLGKGTGSILASSYPKEGRKLPSGGIVISSARGTSKKYLP